MQDIDLAKNKSGTGIGELTMTVSPVCSRKGETVAYVLFSEARGEMAGAANNDAPVGIREAEGEIPACVIIRNKGFSEEEQEALEQYMKANLSNLKRMAASINPMDVFLGRSR